MKDNTYPQNQENYALPESLFFYRTFTAPIFAHSKSSTSALGPGRWELGGWGAYLNEGWWAALKAAAKAMKSSPLLGPFCGPEFWGFSLLKI